MLLPVVYILTSLWLMAGIIYFVHRRADYSQIRYTISELGEVGAHDERAVGYGLFLPVGIILLLAGLFTYVQTGTQALAGLSASVGIGYTVAAFFPCGKGSPLTGSTRQQVHNLGGFVEYVGGAYFLSRAAATFSSHGFDLAGYVVLAVAVSWSVPPLFSWRGLIQRAGEIILFGALVALSLR